MTTRAVLLLVLGMLSARPGAAEESINVWREPLETGLRIDLGEESPTGPYCPLDISIDLADEDASLDGLMEPPTRERQLQAWTDATPRPLTAIEQGAVDIQYCPHYLPDLYPGATVGQMCAGDLLDSPFILQGEHGASFFGRAFDEVEQMEANDTDIAIKSAIALTYYWQNRDSGDAVAGALRTFLTEESVGLYAALSSFAAPRVVDALPEELTGLPVPDAFGTGVDLRTTSQATYKSLNNVQKMLLTAVERGLTGVAITDLDHTAGYDEVRLLADDMRRRGELPDDFIVIRGEEVYTLSGPLIALFIEDRIPRGMTMRTAIRDIHRQGGVAILADPGTGSGSKLVRSMPIDGYLLRSKPNSVFRTLELMGDLSLAGKPLLAASGARTPGLVGLPYTVTEAGDGSAEGVQQALRDHAAFGVTNIQMPVLTALVFRPLVPVEKTLVSWFDMRDTAEAQLQKWIGSDNVEIRTTYDDPLVDMLGLIHAPTALADVVSGKSPLTRSPDLVRISADYSYIRLEWDRADDEVRLMGAIRF